MKILFLCGSLEPGKDGVGDYTRRLAGELIRRGYPSQIIALNDYFVSVATANTQNDENEVVNVLRLPAALSWTEKFNKVQSIISHFSPDWLSLQYVLYAFHKKGLPFGLNQFLQDLGKGRKWHIMFHELWVGMEDSWNLKAMVYEKLQSHIIFKLIAKLKPEVIHTQTKLYQAQIERRGYRASKLPLFGNIPVYKEGRFEKKNQVAIFGSIHSGATIKEFALLYARFSSLFVPSLKFLFMGRNGPEREKWIRICEKASIPTEILGELTVVKVSEVLQTCIAGISTTPLLLADKSGVVAALREHHLPIIDLGRPWNAKGLNNVSAPEGLISAKDFFEKYSHYFQTESQYKYGIEYTTRLFIHDIHLNTF